jgi:hypothetical protein
MVELEEPVGTVEAPVDCGKEDAFEVGNIHGSEEVHERAVHIGAESIAV